MNSTTIAMAAPNTNLSAGAVGDGVQPKIEILELDHSDSDQFRAALDRQMGAGDIVGKSDPARKSNSLGQVLATRATGLATEVKKDQQYVSKLLEQATRTGDELHLMRAMMALNDFQLRVQTISKTVSKAATSIDSLTKLQ